MFAEVILKRKLPPQFDTLTYEVPKGISGKTGLQPGQTVMVPFGKTRIAGVITEISSTRKAQDDFPVKNIFGALSEELLLKPWQIQLATWMADYYLCSLSKVIPLFLPKKAWDLETLKKLKTAGRKKSVHEWKPHHHELTSAQKNILQTIDQTPRGKFLIHGVTGSGKTEVYLRLARKKIDEGFQVLFLVPEIALTPQLIDFIESHFENTPITVLHSHLTERERDLGWFAIYSGQTKIIVGSRSALFAPFQNLGLIIMDEEHEWTYKQEQTPRYHARKVAEKMAELTGATLVLGSATPDIETYFSTMPAGQPFQETAATRTDLQIDHRSLSAPSAYHLLRLPDRIAETPMPETSIVDMREEIRKKNFSMFSDLLREKLAQTLAQKKQIILFMNRRGVAPATLCRDCGYIARCGECEVALVLHGLESGFVLMCHHCGKRATPPTVCPECESSYIKSIGVGTEKVEEEIQKLFSLARVYRADRDTMTKKSDYHVLYEKLKNHDIDILVGTQMIAKGFDLPKVHFVGVILADTSLSFPDFRASERTFQLLAQVSGRAGRRDEQGEVIIQTYHPDHPAIQAAASHDYKKFFENEIEIRRSLLYPPFSKIIRLSFSHKNLEACKKTVLEIEQKLRENLGGSRGSRLEGQEERDEVDRIKIASFPSFIPRLHGEYHYEILVRGQHPERLVKPLNLPPPWSIDVDPM